MKKIIFLLLFIIVADSFLKAQTTADSGYLILRHHYSVTVELHPSPAILKGKLAVHKKNKEKTDRYHLIYMGVCVKGVTVVVGVACNDF